MKYYLKVYGCQMNKYDGLLIETILDSAGHRKVERADESDIIIVNTCSVRDHAEKRALGHSRVLSGLGKKIAICGCMAQRMGRSLLDELGADYIVGPGCYQTLPGIIETDGPVVAIDHDDELYESVIPKHNAVTVMVTVMRGCDNYCSYCIVPFVRGRVRSRKVESVITEVHEAVSSGGKEALLLGQDITSYQHGNVNLAQLIEEVSRVEGLRRIRFITSHPRGFGQDLIEVIGNNSKVCPHVHLPLQSGSNRILDLMNRGYTIESYLELVDQIRKAVPGVSITTDLIVGFPSETDEDYQMTIDVVRKLRFDFAYMFCYSDRPGTAAVKITPKIPDALIKKRLIELIRLQNTITKENNEWLVGKRVEILIEQRGRRGNFLGRNPQNIMIAVDESVEIGGIYEVEVNEVRGWTPVGRIVGEVQV
ncbi:MAG TPA: tRNA (N6-isopentenyl adenosine(37)-C2)-methylthiotransferase MiaB [bacterium (Candidatus Stahlbacteria)]|nr:tRNA (N6-isopentenyl adenosine(37)-C2)-methylthiotransferase MiaB [Candidatus Stahlbacteria bacterium]